MLASTVLTHAFALHLNRLFMLLSIVIILIPLSARPCVVTSSAYLYSAVGQLGFGTRSIVSFSCAKLVLFLNIPNKNIKKLQKTINF